MYMLHVGGFVVPVNVVNTLLHVFRHIFFILNFFFLFSLAQPAVQSSRPKCLTNSLSKPFSQLHLRSRFVGQVEAMKEAIGTAKGEGREKEEGEEKREEEPGSPLSDKLCAQLRAALKNGTCNIHVIACTCTLSYVLIQLYTSNNMVL